MFEDLKSQSKTGGRVDLGPLEAHLDAFQAYWASKRDGADLPRRAEIDPRGIEPLLQYAFIAEKIAPGLARMRIAGMHLSDLMGMEVRGMPVSTFIDPADRDTLADHMVELFDRPARIELDIASEGGFGRARLAGRIVMLPLRSDLGDVSRALGCLVTQGAMGRAPRRFRITGQRVVPIDLSHAPSTTTTTTTAATPVLAPVPGLAEAPAQFQGKANRLASERSYLRLVR